MGLYDTVSVHCPVPTTQTQMFFRLCILQLLTQSYGTFFILPLFVFIDYNGDGAARFYLLIFNNLIIDTISIIYDLAAFSRSHPHALIPF